MVTQLYSSSIDQRQYRTFSISYPDGPLAVRQVRGFTRFSYRLKEFDCNNLGIHLYYINILSIHIEKQAKIELKMSNNPRITLFFAGPGDVITPGPVCCGKHVTIKTY